MLSTTESQQRLPSLPFASLHFAMEEATEFQDWELLHGPDAVIAAPASATTGASRAPGGDSDGVVNPDYFGLYTESRCPRRSSSSDGDLDLDDPSSVEAHYGSRFLAGEGLGFSAAEFPRPDLGGFWTPEKSSGWEETPSHHHVMGEPDSIVGSQSEVVLEGVNSNEAEGEGEKIGVCSGGSVETDVVDAGSEVSGELDATGDGENITVALESPVERSSGDRDLENLNVAKGEKSGIVWWKLPTDILKFCVFRIRPVWSISIAAALLGLLALRRKLYKKRPKSRSIPLKVSVDEKRVSQFMLQATRLNEAFSVVKRVPVIRSTLPTASVTPWPVVALR